VVGLVWPFDRHAEISGLFLGELRQLHADAVERDDVAIAGGRHVDVADAERVFKRGDLIISMMPTLEKTFRSFGKMISMRTVFVVRLKINFTRGKNKFCAGQG
jgi:hypothetical protein